MKKYFYKIRLTAAAILLAAAIIGVLGFYPLPVMHIEFTPLLERNITNFTFLTLISLAVLLVITLLFGRFYCSTLCPFGILQEFVNLIYNKIKGKKLPNIEYIELNPVKYYILALCFGTLIGTSALVIRYFDPYTIFGSFVSISAYGIIITFAVLVLVFFKNRFFCTSICPVGALLGLISKFSVFKMQMDDNCIKCGMCARYCPSKCIDKDNKKVNNENCVKCLKCTSVCPKNAMKYGIKKQEFNPDRRSAVVSITSFALFVSMAALGAKFARDLGDKIKNIILPAGAKDANSMLNKCLNCNLCINNCPQGILEKANKEISAVHINYEKGKHYCKYDCHKCSLVCPSGAIKRISLAQKQNTRIAMASVNRNCIGCSACIRKCPKGAIELIDGAAKVDGAKCIGCGLCKAVCPMSAIDIYPISKQTSL
ncbi:4Fe-4S binding protein [bacterium]|nr:4Fe-4S binding protein [bacterium]